MTSHETINIFGFHCSSFSAAHTAGNDRGAWEENCFLRAQKISFPTPLSIGHIFSIDIWQKRCLIVKQSIFLELSSKNKLKNCPPGYYSQVSVYFWTTFKLYNLNASWISRNFVEVTQIEMAALFDLEGLPETPQLYLASSRTKLKKNKKTIINKLNYTRSNIALQKQSNLHGQTILTKSAPWQYLRPNTGQVDELRLCSRQH